VETTEEVSSRGVEKRGKGTNVNEALLLPEKNRGRTGKVTCKSVEQEENHEKGPRGSWARNHMGNVSKNVDFDITSVL
jgi:hypothetical protein